MNDQIYIFTEFLKNFNITNYEVDIHYNLLFANEYIKLIMQKNYSLNTVFIILKKDNFGKIFDEFKHFQ